tara:strand:- start:272 stop:457 length:186 start_codon:yes stop_codon:yes gene_type:complete
MSSKIGFIQHQRNHNWVGSENAPKDCEFCQAKVKNFARKKRLATSKEAESILNIIKAVRKF